MTTKKKDDAADVRVAATEALADQQVVVECADEANIQGGAAPAAPQGGVGPHLPPLATTALIGPADTDGPLDDPPVSPPAGAVNTARSEPNTATGNGTPGAVHAAPSTPSAATGSNTPSTPATVAGDGGLTQPAGTARTLYEPPQDLATDRTPPLISERDPPKPIVVGGGGKLVVPREDITSDVDIGEELDLKDLQAKKIRKPGRREFFALNPDSELTTRLLLHKPKADGMEVEPYYIHRDLRSAIREELKDVRVLVYYSFLTHSYNLWVIGVTIDNSWYESLQLLLTQPPSFFAENAIRVISDKPNGRYRIKFKSMPEPVAWPTKSTEELLGEALGTARFINSAEHPIYRDLIDGVELR